VIRRIELLIIALLIGSVFAMHYFAWLLGLVYRDVHDRVHWVWQELEHERVERRLQQQAEERSTQRAAQRRASTRRRAWARRERAVSVGYCSVAVPRLALQSRVMRIALCQINPTIGDIAGNCRKIIAFIERAQAQGATLAVFPELAVPGYPPKDLLLKRQFVDDNLRGRSADRVARARGNRRDRRLRRSQRPAVGRRCINAVAVLRDGKIVSRHLKTLLPTYDVFDESGTSSPARATSARTSCASATRSSDRASAKICGTTNGSSPAGSITKTRSPI